jgi:LPS-assembly protein
MISVRTVIGGRYSPGDFRVVSAAYRLQRGTSELIDVGWQWPLRDLMPGPRVPALGAGRGLGPGHWYSVGRVNFSLKDRRVVDLIAGFEYDAGCWIGRVVLERLQQSRNSANQRILFQLEFSGFSRLGSNPLQTLRDNVPRYQYLREQINPPSRFERYD